MNFLEANDDKLVFLIEPRGRRVLRKLCLKYPSLEVSYFELCRTMDEEELPDGREVADQSLREEQSEVRKRILKLLADESRFEETEGFLLMRLTMEEVDLLLQVLNDVRIGCWSRAGSPSEGGEELMRSDPKLAPLLAAMQLCGFFQGALLDGLNRQKNPPSDEDDGFDLEDLSI